LQGAALGIICFTHFVRRLLLENNQNDNNHHNHISFR
jgi:hypothetical protein